MPPSQPGGPRPRVIFVNGLHRSGTTVIAEAATEASDGVTVTAGLIAESNPYLRELLDAAARGGPSVDRGVDARPLSEDLAEEYGWLLRDVGRVPAPNVRPQTIPTLVAIIERLAAQEGARAVVLKNPWDFGREQALLDLDPNAYILLVRRSMSAVGASRRRALHRYGSSDAYISALTRHAPGVRMMVAAMRRRRGRALILWLSAWGARMRVLAFLARAPALPLDRVAFLSFEELQEDDEGARWAAHVLDPERFSRALRERLWNMGAPKTARRALPDVLIDRLWERVWKRLRAAQTAQMATTAPGP
ncbi:MAG TPA: sulfotransferase [Solirubrobacteraceae bacterium]|nr:sulfotransferase [Solirubrobacteraceae bacterium]